MDLLKQKIRENGVFIGTDIVKVDMFLNHQIDIRLLEEMGKEFKRLFDGEKITKILTVEVSGIAIACMAAKEFDVPVVFAKKTEENRKGHDPDRVYHCPVCIQHCCCRYG